MFEPAVLDSPETDEIDRTERDPITKLADGRFCATVDPGDGSPVQKFYGSTKQQVIAKLIEAQSHATKKIREQKRLLKTGHAQTEPAQPVTEFKPRSLSTDEQWRISQDLQDPTKTASAVKRLIEAEIGAPVDIVRSTLNLAQQQARRAKWIEEARVFVDEQPDYHNVPENERLLVQYLESHKLDYTATNLAVAFEDLSSGGLLQVKPATDNSPGPEPAPEQVTQPTGERVRPRSAQTGIPARASTPRPAPVQVRLTADEVNRMSPEEYRRRLNDPQFRAAVDKLFAPAPQR
ncbi:MAG TPA: hypothetical protein VHU83_06680 [Bryobacteraceae bacterium]|jgi:hypothetical protein|nr:hypothetical protein [Bryobacteraceae bacterium]